MEIYIKAKIVIDRGELGRTLTVHLIEFTCPTINAVGPRPRGFLPSAAASTATLLSTCTCN